ncbi:MAG: sensor histidine kinase, partial [Sulfurovaceae bacterium]
QDNLADIDFSAYVLKLTDYILQTNKGTENIKVEIEMIPLKLPIESMIQFGIMINELMINSIKYAFNGKGGTIALGLETLNNKLIFSYKDDGKGFDITNTPKGFGANLVEMTVSQLDAKMTMDTHKGTTYKIEFTRENNENSHS